MKYPTIKTGLLLAYLSTATLVIAAPEESNLKLARLPQAASWTITFKYRSDEKPSDPSAPPRAIKSNPYISVEQVRKIEVTRTGKVCRELIAMTSGSHTESWIVKNMRLATLPGRDQIVARPFLTEAGERFDYRTMDFEGLEWIGQQSFRGVLKIGGRDYWLFEKNSSSDPSATPISPIGRWNQTPAALVVPETRLPAFYYDGEAERSYVFNPPPVEQLAPPPSFLKLFQEWSAHEP